MEKQSSFLLQAAKFIGRLWVIVTAVIGSLLLVGVVFLAVAVSSGSKEPSKPRFTEKVIKKADKEKIAVVYLHGAISEEDAGGGFSSGTTISSKKLIKMLEYIEEQNDVKAVVLHINSPGGAVVASDDIFRALQKLQKKKVVISSLGDTAASGGYYIAAGTNKIVANPATVTGSIGVIAQLPQLSGLYDKIGVQMRVFKSGQFKDIGSEARDVTPEEAAILNSIISDSYDQFVSAVASSRKMDEAKVRQLADGRIYTGKQAKENGLVDELGNIDTAIDSAKEMAKVSNPTIVEYSDGGFLETLFGAKNVFPTSTEVVKQILPSNKFGVYYLMSL